jgi:hypothetical protein
MMGFIARPTVMPALVAGIHVFPEHPKTWMAGTSPAMTANSRYIRSNNCRIIMVTRPVGVSISSMIEK